MLGLRPVFHSCRVLLLSASSLKLRRKPKAKKMELVKKMKKTRKKMRWRWGLEKKIEKGWMKERDGTDEGGFS